MELSEQVQELLQRYRFLSKQNEDSIRSEKTNLSSDYEIIFNRDDLINVDKIDFSNDETWLCDSVVSESNKMDLNRWLYEEADVAKDMTFRVNRASLLKEVSNLKKNIDTRTFTRPKKKYTRPSIEKYNEELYESEKKNEDELNTTQVQNPSVNIEKLKIGASPLYFDLSQPVSRDNFDNILNGSVGIDSFLNMSPPSLVTSLCSSTFTNLMENSLIKNDPVLREIRDADYSNEILIQDSDPPIFQSFTESCSSLNSDSAENFLRQTLPTLNATFHKDLSADTSKSDSSDGSGNSTLKCNASDDLDLTKCLNQTFRKREVNAPNVSTSDLEIQDNLNNTFKRNVTKDVGLSNDLNLQGEVRLNLNETFQKPSNIYNHIMNYNSCSNNEDKSSNSSIMDVYFNTAMSGNSPKKHSSHAVSRENIDPNTTITISTVPNGTFRKDHKMNNKLAHNNKNSTYTNNLSDKFNDKLNSTFDYNIKDETRGTHPTSDVKRHSIGYVTGSTDSLDHMSSLSNSSRGSRGSNRILNMAEVDAIVELQERSLQIMSTPKPAKSMSKLFEPHLISPIVRQKEHVSDSDLSSTDDFLTVRSSLSKASSGHSEKNLKTLDRSAKSLSNLKQNPDLKFKPRGINTLTKPVSGLKTESKLTEGNVRNLRSIGTRGSYTTLKTVGVNLPVITSKPNSAPATTNNLNVTLTKTDEVFKIPAAPSDQLKPLSAPANTATKSQARVSNLPRPVGTGIPRPVSKIPGPRTLRPPSVRPLSKASITDGYF